MSKYSKTREIILNDFLNALEEQKIPWQKPWNHNIHPVHAITHRPYSGVNALILFSSAMSHNYEDPRWLTFQQIQEQGWRLKNAKGQGVPIEFWSLYDAKNKKLITSKEAKQLTEADPEYPIKHICKNYYLFNAALIEGIEPYYSSFEMKQADLQNFFTSYLETEGIALKSTFFDNKAYYNPQLDEIHIPPIQTFKTEYHYFDTLAHEIGHSSGHPSRLNRDLKGKNDKEAYAREELRAELSSVFLNMDLGIPLCDSRMDNHKAYIQSWIALLKEQPKELFDAIRDAEQIKDFVLEKGNFQYYLSRKLEDSLKMEDETLEEVSPKM